MKKALLLLLSASLATAASAQVSLSGTSYTQTFDNLSSGLPTGWAVYTKATSTSLGTDWSNTAQFLSVPTRWNFTGGNFRNVASADGFSATNIPDTTAQQAATDRALGLRQVGNTSATFPGSDSGAAFVLKIANTNGLTNFQMTFKLQSLDTSSPRVTTWLVDYGTGATPSSFTPATATGTLTTGNKTFSNNTITVNFGSALNNLTGPVWIRIATLTGTTGSGNRTTSAIDDVNLTWSGAAVNNKPVVVSKTPLNNATGVAVTSNLVITFDKNVTAGTGNIYIRNATDGTVTTKAAASADVTISGMTATVSNLGLLNSKVYRVTFDSTAFMSGVYNSEGIYDTTAWKFTTGSSGIAQQSKGNLPVSVLGAATTSAVTVAFTAATTGTYMVSLYDLAGREAVRQEVVAAAGTTPRVVLSAASLQVGLYTVRVANAENFGVTKAMIQ
jgi:hypothetical protein